MFNFKFSYCKISDEDLMKGVQSGDQKAFNELYRRYANKMQYYFYRMLGNSQEIAKDFLQDLFYKIISKPDLFDCNKKFSTWLYSIAHNMCKNQYRNAKTKNQIYLDDSMELQEDTFKPSNKEKSYNQLIALIFEELKNYDEIHKTVFLLKYKEGFDMQEIAEITDVSVGTVKSRLFYTRKKLQEKLASYKENLLN